MKMKRYKCEFYECDAPENCCLFCKHCTDVFFDYTNGPYLFICDLGNNGDYRICNQFEADEETSEGE